MSGGGKHGDYWPGFVDALTNVVIAMVFVIVVLAIALSFSAQLLAQRMAAQIAKLQQSGAAASAVERPRLDARDDRARSEQEGPGRPGGAETIVEARVPERTRIAVTGAPPSASASGAQVRAAAQFVQLDFAQAALALDADAARRLADALPPFRERLAAAAPGARIALVATGPDMQLSENQRVALIRVLAVRNALLDQGIAAARIATRIDTQTRAPQASVALRLEDPT